MTWEDTRRKLPWIKLQDLVAWTYLYPVRLLARLFPPRVLCGAVEAIAPLYVKLRSRPRAAITRQLRLAYQGRECPAAPERIATDWMVRDLRKTTDDLVMCRLDLDRLAERVRIDGLVNLDEALAAGRGALVVSGHFHGNRLAKFYLRRRGYPMLSLRNRNPYSLAMGRFGNRFVAPAYGRFLDRIVEDEYHEQDPGKQAGIIRRLRENGIVNLHIDVSAAQHGKPVPFLNGRTVMAYGFIRLAELTRAPVVPMQCRGNSSALVIRFEKPVKYESRSSEPALSGELDRYRAMLENWVSEHPAEWEMWLRRAAMRDRRDKD